MMRGTGVGSALMVAALVASCAATNRYVLDKCAVETTVEVPHDGDTVPTTLCSYSEEGDLAIGIRQMTARDYADARKSFESAVARTDGNSRRNAYHALGVACEMLGALADAESAYKQANLLDDKAKYERDILRVQKKLGKSK
ncbi:MAG: tetratricopeptide repeat protein [Planctomycetota bacterium]|nr:tetratricopeptide repeat protein [Planctomycetota bacterium]